MARTTLKTAWERLQVLAYPRYLRTAFTALNAMLTELYPNSQAVTATADGLTTGLISAGQSKIVIVTSANAAHQITLPEGAVGDRYRILVGATACELICATAGDKINNIVCGATNEALLTATNLYDVQYVATNLWVLTGLTNLGAVQTAVIPDAR